MADQQANTANINGDVGPAQEPAHSNSSEPSAVPWRIQLAELIQELSSTRYLLQCEVSEVLQRLPSDERLASLGLSTSTQRYFAVERNILREQLRLLSDNIEGLWRTAYEETNAIQQEMEGRSDEEAAPRVELALQLAHEGDRFLNEMRDLEDKVESLWQRGDDMEQELQCVQQ